MTPIIINNVEVLSIDKVNKKFSMLVHIAAEPMQMYTPEVKLLVKQSTAMAIKYLMAEDFIPNSTEEIKKWYGTVSGVCHSPQH